jgi:hypothetical protein
MAPNAGGLLPVSPEVLPARSGVPVGIQIADGHLLAYDPAVEPAGHKQEYQNVMVCCPYLGYTYVAAAVPVVLHGMLRCLGIA